MKKVNERTEELRPIITERKIWDTQNLIFAMIMGFVIIGSIITILYLYPMGSIEAIAMVAIFIAFYSIFLFFLVKPQIHTEIQKQQIITKTYEKPIVKEIVKEVIKEIEKPIIKEVIKEIEKPIIKKVPVTKTVIKKVPVTKTYIIEKPRKKLNIPKYEFFGSTQTKTYHKSSCRLRKLIKRKYKESAHTEKHFLTRGYKPCKICLKAKKVKKVKVKRITKKEKPIRKMKKPKSSIAKRASEIRRKETKKKKEVKKLDN